MFRMGIRIEKGNQEGVRPAVSPPWERKNGQSSKQSTLILELAKRYENALNEAKQAGIELANALAERLRNVVPDIKGWLDWRDLNFIYLHSNAKLCDYSVSDIQNRLENVICAIFKEYGIEKPYISSPYICLSEEEKERVVSLLRNALSSD